MASAIRSITVLLGILLVTTAYAGRSLRIDRPDSGAPSVPPLQWGCYITNWVSNIYPAIGQTGPYPYPFTMFNPGNVTTALVPGTDDGTYSVVGCGPTPPAADFNPNDSSTVYQPSSNYQPNGQTNESFSVNKDPGFVPVGGQMYFFVPDASPNSVSAEAIVWTLTNGDTEIELDGWCPTGATTASFSWSGTAYFVDCTVSSAPSDFIFDASGHLIGYVNDPGSYPSEDFTGNTTSGSSTVTNVTVPSDLSVGMFINDAGSAQAFPPGTTVAAIGMNAIQMSAPATATTSGDDISYCPFTLVLGGVPLTSLPTGWQRMVLAPPSDLSSSSTSSAVTLTWMPPSGVLSYNLYTGPSLTTAGAMLDTFGITSPTQRYTNWPPGTTYFFAVAAVYQDGFVSPLSNSVQSTAVPATPSGLKVSSTAGGSATLQWTASTAAITYDVYQGTSAGGEATTPIATGVAITSYAVSGLATGGTYYFKIAAINAGGLSAVSNEASLTLVAAAPANVASQSGSAEITLHWTSSAGATSYSVYEGTSAGAESSTPVATGISANTVTVSGLTPGKTYYFAVEAVDAAGNSAASTETSATVLAAVPTGFTAKPGNASVSLIWSASSGASSYNIYQGTTAGQEGSTPILTAVTGTSATISDLTNGDAYFFTVAAVDAGGVSAPSGEVNATPQTSSTTSSGGGSGGGGGLSSWELMLGGLLILFRFRRDPMRRVQP